MSGYSASVKPGECFFLTHYVTRRVAFPLARLFKGLGWTPNGVTVLGGCCWMVSAVLVVLGGWWLGQGNGALGWSGMLVAAALWNLGAILDVVDGSLARMTESGSKSGSYLDFSFHVIHGPLFLAAIALAIGFATGYPLLFALVAMFAVPVNFGTTHHAKDHILCEDVAMGKCDPGSFSEDERYELFVDSPQRKASVGTKSSGVALLVQLAFELMWFPGQFELYGLLLALDWGIWMLGGPLLWLTGLVLCFTVLVGVVRLPFRVKREFRRMQLYDRILAREAGGGAAGQDDGDGKD